MAVFQLITLPAALPVSAGDVVILLGEARSALASTATTPTWLQQAGVRYYGVTDHANLLPAEQMATLAQLKVAFITPATWVALAAAETPIITYR